MTVTCKRVLSIVACLAFAMILSVFLPGGEVSAKTVKMNAPSKIVCQTKDSAGNWVTKNTYTLTYNKKKDVTKIVNDIEEEGTSTINIKYTYKKGVKKTASIKGNNFRETYKFNKKGQLIKWVDKDTYWHNTLTETFKYNKKGYPVTVKWIDQEDSSKAKGTDKYSVKMKKGLPTKITIKTSSKGGKQTIIKKYNKKGFVTSVKIGKTTVKYKYAMKGKYVKTLYLNTGSGYDTRQIYTYSKVKIPKQDYLNMINREDWTMFGLIPGF